MPKVNLMPTYSSIGAVTYMMPVPIGNITIEFIVKPSLVERLQGHWGLFEMEKVFDKEIAGYVASIGLLPVANFSTLLNNYLFFKNIQVKGYPVYNFMINLILTSPHTKLDFLVDFVSELTQRAKRNLNEV